MCADRSGGPGSRVLLDLTLKRDGSKDVPKRTRSCRVLLSQAK
jgi:hypothetical protein